MMTRSRQGSRAGQPLRVAMLTKRPPCDLGGVERVVASLLEQLTRGQPGWELSAISAFRQGDRLEGIDVLSDVLASLRLGRRLRASPVDVAFVHCPECLWGVRLLRRRGKGAPIVIAVWHGAGATPYLRLRRPGHPLARLLARIRTAEERLALPADGHIAVHAQVATNLGSEYGYKGEVTVIENALDPAMAKLLATTSPRRERTGLTALWAGQTAYRKGLDVALAAVEEARSALPGLRLRVAGVAPGKAAEGVEWLGLLPPSAMAAAYRDADLFIFPTRYESFGLVAVEAMAAGLPMIVSDAVAAGIVTHGRNGIVIRGHDPRQYAQALRQLADPRIRAAMAEANVADARRFAIDAAASGYAAVAESLMKSRQACGRVAGTAGPWPGQ
jgi:glycosyltransferase involved in cell wall biosynthesis